MPRNTLAPGFIRLYQTTTISSVAADHSQEIGINPSTWAGAVTTIINKAGATIQWDTALNALLVPLKALFAPATIFTNAELWRKDTPSSDPIFVANVALAIAGTNGGAAQAATQVVYAFKGQDDSDMRFTLLEASRAHNARLSYTGLTAGEKALVDYIYSSTTWLYTRGNSYPASFGFMTSKINDKLREQRLNL